MTPAEFRDRVIAACERQMAKGARLVSNRFGNAECGCFIELAAADAGFTAGRINSILWPETIGVAYLAAVEMIDGFDGKPARHAELEDWHTAGREVRVHFGDRVQM